MMKVIIPSSWTSDILEVTREMNGERTGHVTQESLSKAERFHIDHVGLEHKTTAFTTR